jgi:hypothetical protein
MQKSILSLFDYSGVWSQPYVDAGYDVVRVDLQYPEGVCQVENNLIHIGMDILDFNSEWKEYWGILAAPDCSCFSRVGARWWPRQDKEGKTAHAMECFRKALELCDTAEGWWALENPPGRLHKLMPEIGPPSWQYQPYHYGDPWSKQTYIWGTATYPEPSDVVELPPTRRSPNGRTQGRVYGMSSSWKNQRAQTPEGFAKEFYKYNK